MAVEKIIINGEAVDLTDGGSLSLEITSNLLKKLEDMSACYSYTYALPTTLRNKRIFGDLLTIGRSGNKVRQYLRAEYYRDGLLIFDGRCYVSEATEKAINVYFVFGINEALQQIKADGLKLHDIFNPLSFDYSYPLRHTYTEQETARLKMALPGAQATRLPKCEPFPYAPTDDKWARYFFQQNNIGSDEWNDCALTPAVSLYGILEQLKSLYGITLDVKNRPLDLSRYFLQVPNKRRKDRFAMALTEVNHQYGEFAIDWYDKLTSDTSALNDDDLGHRQYFEVDGYKVYNTINVKQPYRVRRVEFIASGFSCDSGTAYVVPKFNPNSYGQISAKLFEWTSADDVLEGYLDFVDRGIETDYNAGEGVSVIFANTPAGFSIQNLEVTFLCQLKAEDVGNGYFNAFDCLPDISIAEFINEYLFGFYGAYPINSLRGGASKVVECVNLNDVKRGTAYDWSEKLIDKDLKVFPKIDGLAKKNWIKYKEKKNVHRLGFNLPTEDETLEDEEDLFVSAIGKYYEPNYILTKDMTEKQEEVPVFVEVDPTRYNVYSIHPNVRFAALTNSHLEWLNGEGPSAALAEVLRHPLRVECKLRLTSLDLATLDLSRPVYLKQFGAFFFIDGLTVGPELTDAKLIKLY